jgi:anti-anti-sigma factor
MASPTDETGAQPVPPGPAEALRISTPQEMNGVTVVNVAGEVDLASSPRLRTALLSLLDDRHPGVLVVGLSEVSFLDSTGLGALVAVHRRARALGVEVRLTAPARGPSMILHVTGLDGAFAIYPTLAEALAGKAASDPRPM